MNKSPNTKVNGNIFKSIVRGVVREELVDFGKSFKREVREEIEDLFDVNFAKYRNETVNNWIQS